MRRTPVTLGWLVAGAALWATCPLAKGPSDGKVAAPTLGLITIQEADQDGGRRWLPRSGAVSDINSELVIAVDHDRLLAAADSLGAGPSPALGQSLQQFVSLLADFQDAVSTLGPALSQWSSATDSHRVDLLADPLSQVAARGRAIIHAAPPGSPLREALNRALQARIDASSGGVGMLDQYAAISDGVRQEIERLRIELAHQEAAGGVYVQMGAWLVRPDQSRPVHLEGFDDYPEGESYEVARGYLPFSDADRAAYEKLIESTKGEAGQQSLRHEAAEQLAALMSVPTGCADEFESRLEDAQTMLKGRADQALQSLKTVAQDVSAVRDQAKQALAGIRAIEQGATSTDPVLAVFDIRRQAEATTAAFKALREGLPAKLQQVLTPLTDRALRDSLSRLLDWNSTQCSQKLELAQHQLDQLLQAWGITLAGSTAAEEALKFGKEVRKLDVQNVPVLTTLPLVRTGYREHGDALLIKLGVGSATVASRTLDARRVELMRVLPHVETAASLVFAQPLGRDGRRGFQSVPSYSVLLKGISGRRSARYYRLFEIGAGVNFSTLDFEHDDRPELGISGVLTMFREYAQVGVGVRPAEGRSFWFFGLKLPFAQSGTTGSTSSGGPPAK